MTCSSDRLQQLLRLMGEAQQRGDMEEFNRLGAEASAIVHSPEMNRKVAQLLMAAAHYAMRRENPPGEADKLRVANNKFRAENNKLREKLNALRRNG